VLEGLETRQLLYATTGNAWPNPDVITISFMPDGTNLGGGVTSNLNSAFNSNANLNGRWQQAIEQAAQQWSQVTNINFIVVNDDGEAEGSGNYEQGNPNFGDIRIGGYNFGTSTLARTEQPPQVNNFSIAGDILFNTGAPYNIGSTYDLKTVAMHELGLALGLDECNGGPNGANAVMYTTYVGVKSSLTADDIAGVQSIYGGVRAPDQYNPGLYANNGSGTNGTMATASNLNSLVSSNGQAYVPNLSLSVPGQVEYFSVTAPSNTNGTLTIADQSLSLSLLSPAFSVYNASGTLLGSISSNPNTTSGMPTLKLSGIYAGEQLYIKAGASAGTAFSTGWYALDMNFAGSSLPYDTGYMFQYANGSPLHSGGGYDDNSANFAGFAQTSPVILGISPDNGFSSGDKVTNTGQISVYGVAMPNSSVQVAVNGKSLGWTTANSLGYWTYNNTANTLANGTYQFSAQSVSSSGVVSAYSPNTNVVIDTAAPPVPVITGITPCQYSNQYNGTTTSQTPTLFGTAEPNSLVVLYNGTTNQAIGSVMSNSNGDWTYRVGSGSTSFQSGPTITNLSSLGLYSTTPIYARDYDRAGNLGGSSITNWVTVIAPNPSYSTSGQLTITSANMLGDFTGTNADGSRNLSGALFVSGTTLSGATVALLEDGQIVGWSDANWFGQFSFAPMTLHSGRHYVSLEVFDQLGNASGILDTTTIIS
jgi:hypothetical protein